MRLAELQYELPPELIAQHPAARRDASRLLVLHRASGRIEHRVFKEIGAFLAAGDCLVLNNTRVVPARFRCQRVTGGQVEGLYLHAEEAGWRVLLKPSARLRVGERLACVGHATGLMIERWLERGEWLVRPVPPIEPLELLARIGETPLPPYIRRATPDAAGPEDVERYQTVYAERPGAVAAPTAGLHFTPDLLAGLAERGVGRATVTLHVGAGTFVPIEAEELANHHMHAEWFEVRPEAAALLREARERGGRIVAVGTTAARVLESRGRAGGAAGAGTASAGLREGIDVAERAFGPGDSGLAGAAVAEAGWTDIFIYPPYRFRAVDVLLTNFHLPGSTLLALVMAFASPELIRIAYQAAIAERYRFYSYGDAMLIL